MIAKTLKQKYIYGSQKLALPRQSTELAILCKTKLPVGGSLDLQLVLDISVAVNLT
jgi:hypothetical protein